MSTQPWRGGDRPRPLLAAIIGDLREFQLGVIAGRFHRAVAELILVSPMPRIRQAHDRIVRWRLQNIVLLHSTLKGLRNKGFGDHASACPPNDGGIALGQLLVGGFGMRGVGGTDVWQYRDES